MKIFNISQTKELDDYTIQNEPIQAESLMLRAAFRFAQKISEEISRNENLLVFAGPGNNGGDAKLIAEWLRKEKYKVTLIDSSDPQTVFPEINENDLIIDGLFGAGINRPLNGRYAAWVKHLNQSKARIYTIDIPSGLFGEDNTGNNPETIVKAYKTFTFQYPKLAFFFAENEVYTGKWEIIDIGLHPEALRQAKSPYYHIEKKDIQSLLKKRRKFDHKGIFGHALIVAGSKGKFGAAVLATQACLRSGVGLTTVHIPADAETILQTTVPEAMIERDKNREYVSEMSRPDAYSAVGIGPGLGLDRAVQNVISGLFIHYRGKLVLDADALNLIAQEKALMDRIPKQSILTPHPKEFERLAGVSSNSFERLQKARKLASQLRSFVVLKGAYTAICFPDQTVYFNSTGNPGMATAGSGDVLTGIITGLAAQSYTAGEAALIGVFLHGLAGDIAAEKYSEEAMIAGDIVASLGDAFRSLLNLKM